MTRADALRKLLALGSLYKDEIFLAMGGDRSQVMQAIEQLSSIGDIHPINHKSIRQLIRLTAEGRRKAFGKSHHETRWVTCK